MFISKRIFNVLNRDQRNEFIFLHVFSFITSALELLSLSLIGPFLAFLMSDDKNNKINEYYLKLFNNDLNDITFGLFLILLLLVSSVFSIINTYKLALFSAKTGTNISNRLLTYYGQKDFLFFSENNTSEIVKNLTAECVRFADLVLNPTVQMNSKIILAIIFFIFMLLFDFLLTSYLFLFLLIIYSLIFIFVRKQIKKNGIDLTQAIEKRYTIVHDFFAGIRDILFLKKHTFFYDKYSSVGIDYQNSRGKNHALSLIPRYIVEFSIYTLLIFVVIAISKSGNQILLQNLILFSLLSLKLLPAIQQIYTNYLQVKGNISCFDLLENLMIDSLQVKEKNINQSINTCTSYKFKELSISQLSYTYPGASKKTLSNININIEAGDCIGIVGSSGSGKSTLINILLGLIQNLKPNTYILKTSPQIQCNEINQIFGYVPQHIYLRDCSVLENIAYGIDVPNINFEKVNECIQLANLDGVINNLKDGLFTKVGERGTQLSGGQIQRIGIARALYTNPQVIVFDEATSALDGISEREIHNSINKLLKSKTIIMIAHRLNTVKDCNKIIVMDNGSINEIGDFQHLLNNNSIFKGMINS